MTTGAGSKLPDEMIVMTRPGLPISVVVRLSVPPLPPARNSWTVPLTATASPTLTVGAEEVKTKMASEVASSVSRHRCRGWGPAYRSRWSAWR
jgi:hypothetical protein